jgi:hypothetical protein
MRSCRKTTCSPEFGRRSRHDHGPDSRREQFR